MMSSWDPEMDDRHFQLGGDAITVNSVNSVHEMNDPTDPLTQFAFSFDIRKVDDMWYQRRNPGAIDPYKNMALRPEEYEAMEKLYEVRIHILRVANQGSSGGTTSGAGDVSRRYIATFTNPFVTERWQALFNVTMKTRIGPWTASIVDQNWFVNFDFAGKCFRWGKRDLAERDAQVVRRDRHEQTNCGIRDEHALPWTVRLRRSRGKRAAPGDRARSADSNPAVLPG